MTVGLTPNHRIISLVLSWDATDFRKQAEKVESSKDRPSKEHIAALREHIAGPREVHELLRSVSMAEQKSIIVVILEFKNPHLMASLSESQHAQCLEWYSAQLSVRDREELIKTFCKAQPDYLTEVMRDAVATYEPYIRGIHSSMDLRPHVTALETFLNDLLETSKPKQVKNDSGGMWKKFGGVTSKAGNNSNSVETRPPSVEEFVAFLNRNRGFLYRYLHEFAKSCAGIREKFRYWAKESVKNFRNESDTAFDATKPRPGAAGAMSATLQEMFARLTPETQQSVLASVNSHATYLSNLESLSSQRMQRVLDAMKNSEKDDSQKTKPQTGSDDVAMSGPGIYLMRWETLLDDALITPGTPHGPIRKGKDVKGQKSWGKTGSESTKDGWDAGAISREEERVVPEAPDVTAVMDALGASFRKAVNRAVGDVGPPTPPDSTSG